MIYDKTTGAAATHTVEVFRGVQPTAEGEDFGIFFSGDVEASDAILSWLEEQGISLDDPDKYALVVPAGEGKHNHSYAWLPIAPAGDDRRLVTEQDAARRVGRPSVAADGDTTRVSVVLPTALLKRLDVAGLALGTTRSHAIRAAVETRVAEMEARVAEIVRRADLHKAQQLAVKAAQDAAEEARQQEILRAPADAVEYVVYYSTAANCGYRTERRPTLEEAFEVAREWNPMGDGVAWTPDDEVRAQAALERRNDYMIVDTSHPEYVEDFLQIFRVVKGS